MRYYDVCIIGGGASGLAAAASLSGALNVCILEKSRPGRKILASGGGRCNITNANADGFSDTVDFFRGLGLELYEDEEGRCYPYSNRAEDVVDVLLADIEQKNTDVITGFSASEVSYGDGKFSVSDGRETVEAGRLIIATGGKSYPQMGTTGDGFKLAKQLGHRVSRVYPVLTPIECEDMPDFAGLRARGALTLLKDGAPEAKSRGEIQFTKDGISGICAFDLTLYMGAEEGERPEEAMKRYQISIDFAPDFTREEVESRNSSFGIVTGRIAEAVAPEVLKDFRLKVSGTKGWKNAQCTAGGVDLSQVNDVTCQSEIIPGLYFTGEVLDIQFQCGGFNLQNAWSTGRRAAAHINESMGMIDADS